MEVYHIGKILKGPYSYNSWLSAKW